MCGKSERPDGNRQEHGRERQRPEPPHRRAGQLGRSPGPAGARAEQDRGERGGCQVVVSSAAFRAGFRPLYQRRRGGQALRITCSRDSRCLASRSLRTTRSEAATRFPSALRGLGRGKAVELSPHLRPGPRARGSEGARCRQPAPMLLAASAKISLPRRHAKTPRPAQRRAPARHARRITAMPAPTIMPGCARRTGRR